MKKVVIFTFSFIFTFSLLFPRVSYANDINEHWAKEAIQELADRRIMDGYGDGIYLPNNSITRSEFTRLILASLNINAENYDSPFNDVNKSAWYYSSVVTAAKLGLVSGKTPTTFEPDKPITRQEISAIIMRGLDMKNVKSVESTDTFLDENTISPYAKSAIKQLQYLGIVSGKVKAPNNQFYFKPLENSTRAEAAVMLVKMLKAIEQPNKIIREVTYEYDFTQLVQQQMALSSRPQTDYKGAWYDASQDMVQYYANPNNFNTDEKNLYQFLVLSGSSGLTPQKLNDNILADKGILKGTANAFIRASKAYNVNDIYLISHALLETGNGTSDLANGIEVGLNKENQAVVVTEQNRENLTAIKKTYNMFGIGAYDHCPNQCGSTNAYDSGWFTVEDAIFGGAKFISGNYIGAGQDTVYKMRWNPLKTATHQYATDVGWATKQTTRIKNMFEIVTNLDGHQLVFEIPRFNNTPKISALPAGAARFNVDRKFAGEKAFMTIEQDRILQVRSGPHVSFEVLGDVLKDLDEVTVIGHNKTWTKVRTNSTDGWLPTDSIELAKDKNSTARISEINLFEESKNLNRIQKEPLNFKSYDHSIATVNFDGLPLYSGPFIEHNVITELTTGTEVIILDENDDFYKVYVHNGISAVTGRVYK